MGRRELNRAELSPKSLKHNAAYYRKTGRGEEDSPGAPDAPTGEAPHDAVLDEVLGLPPACFGKRLRALWYRLAPLIAHPTAADRPLLITFVELMDARDRGPLTPKEDAQLLRLHATLRFRPAKRPKAEVKEANPMAQFLPGA
jgi:hypothetical protein